MKCELQIRVGEVLEMEQFALKAVNDEEKRNHCSVIHFVSFLEASIKMVLEAKQLLQLNVRITPHFKGHKTVSENGIFLHHFVSDYLGL